MKKRFNSTGVCVPRKHYMVDISNKLNEIKTLIDNEFYFTINKPRQYGKTTTLSQLKKLLFDEYLMVNISFEGGLCKAFEDEKVFSNKFLKLMFQSIKGEIEKNIELVQVLNSEVEDLDELSDAITKFIRLSDKEVVLLIDEVDQSSNNQLFLSFIGMLRKKYLSREVEEDYTFKSVILAGLYDVKSLKLKFRKDQESKYNSPWNIAVDFEVDMSFSPVEISTMLKEFSVDNNVEINVEEISKELYFFTGGYPYLVSRLCQIIDEKINTSGNEKWKAELVQNAAKIIIAEKNTLFDTMIKNLENNEVLYNYIEDIIIRGIEKSFNNDNPLIEIGITYGYFKNIDGKVAIANKIFGERIYNYMVSKLENNYSKMDSYNFKAGFLESNGGLNI